MDPDGDIITFSYSGNNNLTVTILGNGYVRLTPEANWSGYEILTFYANDSISQIDSSVNVTVLPVNDAPFNAEIDMSMANLTEGGNQTVSGDASDVDIPYGDILTYNWFSDIFGYIGTGQEINLSLTAGVHNITLNVSDSAGAWVEVVENIEVLPFKIVDINTSDRDADNLPDDWEIEHFDNLTEDGDGDPDNDTFTNRQEWENNTDPNNPNDYPGKTTDKPKPDDDADTSFIEDNWWWILLLIFIIIILLLAAVLLRKKKEEPEEEAPVDKGLECPECGAYVGEAESLCPECGSSFEEEKVELECPECGLTVESGVTTCPECGAEFEIEAKEDAAGEPAEGGEDIDSVDESELEKEPELDEELSDESLDEELDKELEEDLALEDVGDEISDEELEKELDDELGDDAETIEEETTTETTEPPAEAKEEAPEGDNKTETTEK
jgi:DNA-directed RNA polymerase subunit RPC12/RpoP